MKLKYYLRGLGLGIFFTTILMTIEFHVQGTDQLSDEQIIERAEELGMVMNEDETEESGTIADANKNDSGETDETKDDKDKEDASDETGAEDKEEPESDETSKADTEAEENTSAKEENQKDETKASADEKDAEKVAKQDAEAAPDTQTVPETAPEATPEAVPENVQFAINAGEFSDVVSQNLFTNGLVEDAGSFNTYIIDNKYDVMLQPGVYTIPKGSSYEEIAKILTGK